MRFILPKTVSENKKLFKIFGALFGFLILIIILILIYPLVLNLIPTSITEDKISKDFNKEFLGNRMGPLYGVNGFVTKVEDKDSERLIIIQSDVGQIYFVTVNDGTKVNNVVKTIGKTQVETKLNRIPYQEVEVDSRIYLLTSIDLLYENIIQTDQIKFIEIYED